MKWLNGVYAPPPLGEKVEGHGHELQKHCRCGSWHCCECWLFLVLRFFRYFSVIVPFRGFSWLPVSQTLVILLYCIVSYRIESQFPAASQSTQKLVPTPLQRIRRSVRVCTAEI